VSRTDQPDPATSALSPNRVQVQLADRVIPLTTLRAHPERYSALFLRAKAQDGHAVCLCRTDATAKLVIRCRSGRYHLASWPEQGHLHAPGCPWYRTEPALSGSATHAGDAIISTAEGTTIRLSTPLTTRDTPTRTAVPAKTSPAPSAPRKSLGLLALAHYLWEQAQLSIWPGGDAERSWDTCHYRLVEAAAPCSVNGTDLSGALYVVPRFTPAAADHNAATWTAFTHRLGGAAGTHRRGLVLGELREVSPTPYGLRVRVKNLRAPLFMKQALFDRVTRSFRAAFADGLDLRRASRVVLCLADRTARGNVVIEDLAAMLTTTTWLPMDSSHELRLADALVDAGRSFLKPLRYDGGEVFPDFALLDTTPQTYVEVWGVTGRKDYELRKRAKQAHYRAAGKSLLEWDVRDPMPDVSRR
jgi:hypothetical protein